MVYEIARGIEGLPSGRKRTALEAVFENDFLPLFAGRILPLDAEAARVWARLAGAGERRGHLPPTLDCQIAAVAIRHGMTVVTIDRHGFAPLGCELLDPTARTRRRRPDRQDPSARGGEQRLLRRPEEESALHLRHDQPVRGADACERGAKALTTISLRYDVALHKSAGRPYK